MFVPLDKLRFGPNDAQDYRRGEDAELLHRFFLADENVERLRDSRQVYFLIGAKGTGKTAYATYFSEFGANKTSAYDLVLEPKDYGNVIKYAKQLNIKPDDYDMVWDVLLVVLLFVTRSGKTPFKEHLNEEQANALRVIQEYAQFDQRPRLNNAFMLLDELEGFLGVFAEARSHDSGFLSAANPRRKLAWLKQRLLECCEADESGFQFMLFIDGMDVRPSEFPEGMTQELFMRSVRGLAFSVWNLNAYTFVDKDTATRLVLLIRPDIIQQVGFQNLNAKVRDNSILFNWFTPYPDFATSKLFQFSDRLFAQQQSNPEDFERCACWNAYFPYVELQKRRAASEGQVYHEEHSFIAFLRSSFYRPRDIITMLRLMCDEMILAGSGEETQFLKGFMYRNRVRREYSDYLFCAVRDALGFYYTDDVAFLFKQFFDFLAASGFDPRERQFSYELFLRSFDELKDYIERNKIRSSEVFATADTFLQVLYELNVIGYQDQGVKGHRISAWSFRQQSVSNVRPAVKTNTSYILHYGIGRALYPERIA